MASVPFLEIIQFIIVALIAIVSFFIRRWFARQDEFNAALSRRIDEILKQVYATNGRVIALEEWKRNHLQATEMFHKGFHDSVMDIWKRVNDLADQRRP